MKVKVLSFVCAMLGMAASLPAAVIFNSGDSFEGFSVRDFVPRDFGVQLDEGPEKENPHTNDNAIFFTPRPDNNHTLTWNVSAVVEPTDTLTFDVRNVVALGPVTLTVRVYYDGLAKPHEGLVNHPLKDDSYQRVTVTMPPKGKHRVNRIEFYIAENTKVVFVDNLTLTFVDNSVQTGRK